MKSESYFQNKRLKKTQINQHKKLCIKQVQRTIPISITKSLAFNIIYRLLRQIYFIKIFKT